MWRDIADRFRDAGLESADLDARLIVGYALGLDTTGLIANQREPVSAEQLAQIDTLAQRRIAGEPVARLRGTQEFFGLQFELGAETLVPRPETELLVDLALAHLKTSQDPHVLDLGTGTGCIPIALLHEMKNLNAVAVDLSGAALAVAGLNATRHQVADRLNLVEGSWFAPLKAEDQFDLVISNPPYIATPVIASLSPEVRVHDPALALDGGPDGLEAYRQILANVQRHLKPEGRLLLEIGYDQAGPLTLMCRQTGLHNVQVHRDMAGLERVVVASR